MVKFTSNPTRCIFAFLFIMVLLSASRSWPQDIDETVTKKYEYWDNGAIKICNVVAPNGRIRAKATYDSNGIVSKIEKFDSHGHKTEEAHFNDSGNLRNDIDGWAAMRWKYDDDLLVWKTSYGDDGRPIERKYYNEAGHVIARRVVDEADAEYRGNFDPNKLAGKQAVTYYDPAGRVKAKIKVDK
jgi:hypothetical protein